MTTWGDLTTTLEEVVRLTTLSLYGKANSMGTVLEGDDQTKVKHLTTAMAASKTFGNLTYATWSRLFL